MIFIAVILVLILLRDSDWIKIIYNIPDKNILNEMIFSSFTYYIMLAITFLSIWTLVEYLLVLRKHAINKS
jgi:multisubunit Na+/H+ antiporter MnhB subunit